MLPAASSRSRRFPVACLCCGHVRIVRRTQTTNLDAPDCPSCGYVGWREADSGDVVRSFERGIPRLGRRRRLAYA